MPFLHQIGLIILKGLQSWILQRATEKVVHEVLDSAVDAAVKSTAPKWDDNLKKIIDSHVKEGDEKK